MPTPRDKAILTFPTPDLRDIYFVEFVSSKLERYVLSELGDLYPDQDKYPGAKLTHKAPLETGSGMDEMARMVWCSARNAQDVYNAKVTYSGETDAFPIYTRQYLELRATYAKRAALGRLTSVIALGPITNGGTNYTGDSFGHIPLIFTAGAGSGAAGFGVVEDGVIIAAYLTNGGTGYTSAPTISAIGGANLAVTALIQPATALLAHEEDRSAEGDLAGLWVAVTRIYETLPGPETYTPYFEEETGAESRRYEQRVVATTTPKALKSEYPASSGFYVWKSQVKVTTDDAKIGVLVTEVMKKPDSRVEYRKGNFPIPSVVQTGSAPSWVIPPAGPDIPPGPYQGVTYLRTMHGTASPLKLTFSYAIPGTAIPFSPTSAVDSSLACYEVITQPSRILPIDGNTIHRDYRITAVTGSTVVEILQASTPATYVAGDHVIDVDQIQWKGPFERRCVTTVTFPSPSIDPGTAPYS